jgi:hypothetical protein
MIHKYEQVMISKILACKTPIMVLQVIDKKILLIRGKTDDRAMIHQFLKNSLINLRRTNELSINALQFSKVRSAISHLENLRIRYRVL